MKQDRYREFPENAVTSPNKPFELHTGTLPTLERIRHLRNKSKSAPKQSSEAGSFITTRLASELAVG